MTQPFIKGRERNVSPRVHLLGGKGTISMAHESPYSVTTNLRVVC